MSKSSKIIVRALHFARAIFVLAPCSDDSRVKSAIERNWNFGYPLRTLHVFFGAVTTEEEAFKAAAEREQKQEVEGTQNAYELALLLFSPNFTEELLKKYTKEANEIQFDEKANPREYHRRLKFIGIFKGLMAILKKTKQTPLR